VRDWLTGRRRLVLLGGLALVVAVALGVVWGVADAGRIEASEASTTTTAAATTTTEPLLAASLPAPGSTTTEPESSTTTTRRTSGGDGGTDPTTPPPPNQPPVLEDPRISSDGMELTISPVVSDPEGDPVELFFELDGSRLIVPQGAESVTTTVDRGSDYVVGVSVTVGLIDSAGNEVAETFDYELQAITTVTVREIRFEVGGGNCFEEEAAQRIFANLQLDGVVEHLSNETEELRADLTQVTLIDELTGQVKGEPPIQRFMINALFNGQNDSYQGTHTTSDQVLRFLFRNDPCRGSLTYKVDVETR
jgi:hypothetical protein